MEVIIPKVQELVAAFGIKVVTALLILVIGRWVAKFLRNLTGKMMGKGNMDATLVKFVGSLVYFSLLAFVVLAALAQLGIQTTSFIAVIGAAGLAVGLALQGSLANFAAGVLMLIFRPFKVGDYIMDAGVEGVVEEIHIFSTLLVTVDNKAIIVPNAKLTGDNLQAQVAIAYQASSKRGFRDLPPWQPPGVPGKPDMKLVKPPSERVPPLPLCSLQGSNLPTVAEGVADHRVVENEADRLRPHPDGG